MADRRVVVIYIAPETADTTRSVQGSGDYPHTYTPFVERPALAYDPALYPPPAFFGPGVTEAKTWEEVEGAWTLVVCRHATDTRYGSYPLIWELLCNASKLLCHEGTRDQTAHVVDMYFQDYKSECVCDGPAPVHVRSTGYLSRGCQPDAIFWHNYGVYGTGWSGGDVPWYEDKGRVCTEFDGGDGCFWHDVDIAGYRAVMDPSTPPEYKNVGQRLNELGHRTSKDCAERIRLIGPHASGSCSRYRDLGHTYMREEQYELALEAYTTSSEITLAWTGIKDHHDFHWNNRHRAEPLVKLGRYREAREHLAAFVEYFDKTRPLEYRKDYRVKETYKLLEEVEEKLAQEGASRESESECTICMDAIACMCGTSCGHVCMCTECAASVSQCPVCRTDFGPVGAIKIFRS